MAPRQWRGAQRDARMAGEQAGGSSDDDEEGERGEAGGGPGDEGAQQEDAAALADALFANRDQAGEPGGDDASAAMARLDLQQQVRG